METRLNRTASSEGRVSISLHKKLVESRRCIRAEKAPDLTDFMNDVFFGTAKSVDNKVYNLTGTQQRGHIIRDEEDFDSSTRSVSSRMTEEWLEEAKRMVASSPWQCDSPSRLVSSPRFSTSQSKLSTSSLEKRDPLSRSARRHRTQEGISGEILSKTAIHTRNKSEINLSTTQTEESPASSVQKWLSSIDRKITSPTQIANPDPTMSPDPTHLASQPLPPRQSTHRKSRFQTDPNAPLSQPIPTPSPTNFPAISKRTFKNTTTTTNASNGATTMLDNQLLSPPKHLVESAHRRSISSKTCSVSIAEASSPMRNSMEWAHRRSVSSSMCSTDQIQPKGNADDGHVKEGELKAQDLNRFLKENREKVEKLISGEIKGKAKIVLSGSSNSTSSMVAAICYSWLLENRTKANNKGGEGERKDVEVVVPLMNMRRGKMWKQRQAAWLFHHVGLDANALLFSNEVDLETLMMSMQLIILVVGQDILQTKGEVGSACTLLTDNYCEDAYDLLETPMLKKLLLAGILLDTENLYMATKISMNRDAEAVQLLLVGSAPNYRNALFDQLIQDQRDNKFLEVLQQCYGKPSNESARDNGATGKHKVSGRNLSHESTEVKNKHETKKVSPILGKPASSPMQAHDKAQAKTVEAARGKNKSFFARLFGFGPK